MAVTTLEEDGPGQGAGAEAPAADLLDAVAARTGTKGLVQGLESALEAKDFRQARILMLAGLATRDVAQWAAARIPRFIATGASDATSREEVLRRLPTTGIGFGQMAEHVDAVLQGAASAEERRRLLFLVHRALHAPRFSWQLVKELALGGDLEAARTLLAEIEDHGHDLPMARQFHAELLSIAGEHDRAIAIARTLVQKDPDRAMPKRDLLRFLMAAGRTEALDDELPAVLREHGSDWMLAFFLHRARISPETLRTCFALLPPPDARSDPRYCLHYAASAVAVGDLPAAERALGFDIPDAIPYAESFQRAVAHVQGIRLPPGRRFEDDPRAPVQVVRAGRGRPTVTVCFSNTGINFSFLGLGVIDRLLSAHDANVIYLRETRKMMFHGGIEGLGATERDTLAALDGLHEDLGSSRRISLGSSLGGYGAARLGHLGRADAVLSFSGPTDLFEFVDTAIPRSLHAAQFLLMQHARRSLRAEECRLRPLIEQSGARHYQFYGAQEQTDAGQAGHLAGMPNVELVPVEDASDHFVFGHCVADGRFDRVLAEVLS